MKIQVNQRTAKALQKLKEISKTSEEEIQYYLAENIEATIYEISKSLDWNVGKIHGVIIRLLEKGLVKYDRRIEGDKIKKYYRLVLAKDLLID